MSCAFIYDSGKYNQLKLSCIAFGLTCSIQLKPFTFTFELSLSTKYGYETHTEKNVLNLKCKRDKDLELNIPGGSLHW